MDIVTSADSHRKSRRRTGLILPTTYDRLPEDRYFTIESGWIVPALLKRVPIAGPVLEPCAGRGHLVLELRRHGLEVAARDLIAHENPLVDDIETPRDLDALQSLGGFGWIITNPPFTQLDERVDRLLQLGARDGCNMALLLRQEWASPAKRGVLIHDNPNFAGMIVLTARPRWIEDPGGESPRHHFIWAVWTAAPRPANARPWIVFEGRASAKLAVGADAIRAPDFASLAKPTASESETTPDRADPGHDDSGYANSADDEHDGSILPTINGEFAGEIVAGTFMPFGAGRASGGSCVLRLEMREGTRFDIRLKFLTLGPPHIMLRDARALAAWVEAVGAPPTAGFTALGENLWIAGCGKRVLFDLRTHEDHRGLPEVVIVNVRVERKAHA